MPLPDERPRSTVANLIGRFEKGQSSVPPVPAASWRSSSVASHITGDSAKEEVKEKREWPPRSVVETHISLSSKPTAPAPPVEVIPPTPTMDEPQSPPAQVFEKPITPPPSDEIPPKRNGAEISKNGSSLPKTLAAVKRPATSSGTPSKTPVTKQAATPARARTPVKSQAKPPPPRTVARPIKAQHTGQSGSSPPPVARKAALKTSPITPARARTPSHTPIRAKTPVASPRPKTPSSRLFAPTASSLARSLSSAPDIPTPIKKTPAGNSASDRLSKPTAASLQKMRPSVSSSPPSKTATPRPSLATKSTLKSRSSVTPLKKAAKAASAIVGGTALMSSGDEQDTHVLSNPNEGYSEPTIVQRAVEDPIEVPRVESSPLPQELEGHHSEAEPHLAVGHVSDHNIDEPLANGVRAAEVDTQAPDQVEPQSVGNDIEDIVNLLESTPRRSVLIPNAEDVTEIPDED